MNYLGENSARELIRLTKNGIANNSGGSADRVTYDNTTSKLNSDSVQEAIDELANKAGAIEYTAVISTTWPDTAPYTQEIALDGIEVGDDPIVDVILSDDDAIADRQEVEYAKIRKIKTEDNKLIVIAKEPTTMALTIQLVVSRDKIIDVAVIDGNVLMDESVGSEKLSDDAKGLSFTISLLAANWSDNQQTVSNSNFSATGYAYTVAPARTSFEAYVKSVIAADDVTVDGSIVFYCGSAPTEDLTVNVVRVVSV